MNGGGFVCSCPVNHTMTAPLEGTGGSGEFTLMMGQESDSVVWMRRQP
jgi:hypothetical protein